MRVEVGYLRSAQRKAAELARLAAAVIDARRNGPEGRADDCRSGQATFSAYATSQTAEICPLWLIERRRRHLRQIEIEDRPTPHTRLAVLPSSPS